MQEGVLVALLCFRGRPGGGREGTRTDAGCCVQGCWWVYGEGERDVCRIVCPSTFLHLKTLVTARQAAEPQALWAAKWTRDRQLRTCSTATRIRVIPAAFASLQETLLRHHPGHLSKLC